MRRIISIFITLTIIISSGVVSHAEIESEDVNISLDEKLYESNAAYENEELGYDSFNLFSTDEYPNDLESMRARAEEIVNYKWVPSQDIHKWNSSAVFKKGSTVTGMPYTLFVSSDLGHDPLLSLKQYKAKSNSNKSKTHHCVSVGATRTGPIYGSCCATFISNVFGGYFMNGDNPRFDACSQFKNKSGSHAKVFTGKVGSIKEGDALINTECHHIIWVGKITDKNITIYEQTPPVARKKTVSKPSSNSYFIYGGKTYNTIVRPEMTSKVSKPSAPKINIGNVGNATENSVKITWNSVNGATSYRIDGRASSDSDYKTWKNGCTATEYTKTGLKSGTTYYVRLYAQNSAGESGRSATYEIHTKPAQPGKPTAKTLSESEIYVSDWGKIAGADRYKVNYYKLTDGAEKGTTTKYAEGTDYTIKGLSSGTEYGINIVAQDQGKQGSQDVDRVDKNYNSKESPTKTKVTSMSQPKTELLNNNTQIKLTWNGINSTNEYFYRVYRDGAMIKDNIKSTNFTDTSIQDGKTYKYYIAAVQKGQTDERSHSVKASVAVPQKIANVGDNFYASLVTSTGNLPVKCGSGNVFLGDNENTADALWHFERDTDGSYKLTTAATGDVLDASGWGTENGTNVGIYPAHDDDTKTNQRWFIYEQSGGYVLAPSYNTGLALDVNGANIVSGTNIQLWERNNSAAQIYLIRKKNAIGSAPYLNVQTGGVSSDTILSWNSVDGANYYTVSIYKDNSLYKEENVNDTSYSETLPSGDYSIKVTAKNAFTSAVSNDVTFDLGCEHQYGEWTTQQEPTCENKGLRIRSCSICGASQTEEIDAPGHNLEEQTTPATCTEDGETRSACSRCGIVQEITVIPAHGHSFGEWVRTSNDSGIKETRTCSECGITEENIIDEENHNYVLTEETQPTLDAPGTRTYVCSVCGDVHTEEWVETISAGTIKIGGTIANPGETLTVPVSIEDNPGFAGFTFDVKYDKTAVTPVEIIKSDLTESGTFEMNVETDKDGDTIARVVWFTSQNMTDNGKLFDIQFKVNNDAQQGRYPVSVVGEISNDKLSNVVPDILTDYITVGDYLKGDVNLDKVVNGEDATLLAKYLAAFPKKQQTMFSPRQRKAANVYDSDKDVLNHRDGIRLSQIIAGYDISLLEKGDVKLMSNDAASVTVESFDAVPGSELYVPIYIEDNPGIAGFNMHLDYDENKLTLMSLERDEIIQDGRFETTLDESENGVSDGVDIYWIDSDNMTEDGVLFYAVFEVSDSAAIGEELPIEIDTNTVDFSNMYLDSVSTEITQGTVTLAEYTEDNPDDYESEWMPYDISNVSMSVDGTTVEDIPASGDFDVNVEFSANDEEADLGTVIVAAYDENGILVNVSSRDMTAGMLNEGACGLHINACENTIADIKVFIWNSLGGMQAMSDYVRISNEFQSID